MLKWFVIAISVFFYSSSVVAFDVEATFNKTCAICHVPGVAMAPKVGDKSAWAPRMEQGMGALVKAVVEGKGAMPPMGMCSKCNEEQFAALIQHMLPK